MFRKAYLPLICEDEKKLHESVYFPGVEKLNILHSFCLTGTVPEHKVDTFVKELAKYRVLDIVALVTGTACERKTKERGRLPFVDKLVRLSIFARSPLF